MLYAVYKCYSWNMWWICYDNKSNKVIYCLNSRVQQFTVGDYNVVINEMYNRLNYYSQWQQWVTCMSMLQTAAWLQCILHTYIHTHVHTYTRTYIHVLITVNISQLIFSYAVMNSVWISMLITGCIYTWVWAYLRDSLNDAFTMSDRIHDCMAKDSAD